MGFQFRFWTEKLNMTFSKIWYKLKLSGPTCSRGDVVLVASATGFDAGEVACFLSKGNQDMCILYIFSLREKLPKHCVWEEMQSQEGAPLSATFASVFHCKGKKGVTTLTPWQWQWQDQFHQKKSGQKSAIALYVHLQHAITWSCLDVLVTPGALLEAQSAHCLKHTVLVAWSTQCSLLAAHSATSCKSLVFYLWHLDGNYVFFTCLLQSIQYWHSTSIVSLQSSPMSKK